jgi:hypothetical protein
VGLERHDGSSGRDRTGTGTSARKPKGHPLAGFVQSLQSTP